MRLILVYDDVKAYYIKGSYVNNSFLVQKQDFEDREDISYLEKELGINAIEKYNSKNGLQISIVENY